MECQPTEEQFSLTGEQVEKLESFCVVDELIARLFKEVLDDQTAERIAQLDTAEEDDFILASSEAARDGLTRMVAFCSEASPETMARAKADFHKLFVGPQKLPSPPWGSVYIDRRGLLFGPSETEVKAMFMQHGLCRPEDTNEPCDHISYEMQFVAELGKRALAALPDDPQAAHDQLADALVFVEKYLATWHERFAGCVGSNAETTFYQGLALFMRGVVDVQLEWLRTVAS